MTSLTSTQDIYLPNKVYKILKRLRCAYAAYYRMPLAQAHRLNLALNRSPALSLWRLRNLKPVAVPLVIGVGGDC